MPPGKKRIVPEVILLDENGVELGRFNSDEAKHIAKQKGMDYFLIEPDNNPPIAQILDYGKYKYMMNKKKKS